MSILLGPFKRTPGSTVAMSHPDRISANFPYHMLWGLLFLALVVWAEELDISLGPPQPSLKISAARLLNLIFKYFIYLFIYYREGKGRRKRGRET